MEHFEFYHIQQQCIQSYATCLLETIDSKHLQADSGNFIIGIIQMFLRISYQFAEQVALGTTVMSTNETTLITSEFEHFIKGAEVSRQLKSGELWEGQPLTQHTPGKSLVSDPMRPYLPSEEVDDGKSHNPNPEKAVAVSQFSCQECDKTFSTRAVLT